MPTNPGGELTRALEGALKPAAGAGVTVSGPLPMAVARAAAAVAVNTILPFPLDPATGGILVGLAGVTGGDNADNVAVSATDRLLTSSRLFGYDRAGNNWDRLDAVGDDVANVGAATLGRLATASRLYAFRIGAPGWERLTAQLANADGANDLQGLVTSAYHQLMQAGIPRVGQGLGDDADGVAVRSTGLFRCVSELAAINAAGTLDRLRSLGDDADGVAEAALGRLLVLSRAYGYTPGAPGAWNRIYARGDDVDSVGTGSNNKLLTVARVTLLNPAGNWDRARGGIGTATTGAVSNAARVVDATTPTAASTQFTAVAASSVAVAANANRRSCLIVSRATAAADRVAINFGAAAVVATNFQLAPGGSITVTTTQSINVIRVGADVVLDIIEESYV